MPARITVVIPNWNGEALLRQCLQSLSLQSFSDVEIIVVDNASTDGSAGMGATEFPAAQFLRMRTNLGFSRAVNFGLRRAESPLILLLNNDTVVHENCLERLYHRIMAEAERCGGVQCRMMNYFDRERIDSLGIQIRRRRFYDLASGEEYAERHQQRGRVLGLCAGAALFRREFFEHVGLFDKRFFAGYEDVDLALRGIRRGWYFAYEPEAVVYHHRSPTYDTMKSRKRLESRKNMFLLGYKNFPRPYLIRLTLELLHVLQKDLFNIVAHLRKGRLRELWKLYATIFAGMRSARRERRHREISAQRYLAILQESEERGFLAM